jgi:hypothetical protein
LLHLQLYETSDPFLFTKGLRHKLAWMIHLSPDPGAGRSPQVLQIRAGCYEASV